MDQRKRALQGEYNRITRHANRVKHASGQFPIQSDQWIQMQEVAFLIYNERSALMLGYLIALGKGETGPAYDALSEELHEGWIADEERRASR